MCLGANELLSWIYLISHNFLPAIVNLSTSNLGVLVIRISYGTFPLYLGVNPMVHPFFSLISPFGNSSLNS